MIEYSAEDNSDNEAIVSTLSLQDQISNSPYFLPYNLYHVSSENLVLNPLIIPKLIFFFILINCLFDIVLIW